MGELGGWGVGCLHKEPRAVPADFPRALGQQTIVMFCGSQLWISKLRCQAEPEACFMADKEVDFWVSVSGHGDPFERDKVWLDGNHLWQYRTGHFPQCARAENWSHRIVVDG